MPRLVRCPRCSASIDVTQLSGGATVRCAECGAMVRVPTGSTGVLPKVSTPAPAAPPPPPAGGTAVRAGSRGTEIRRSPTRIIRPRSSNTGIIVAAIVSAAAVLIVLIVVLAGSSPSSQPVSRGPAPAPAAARTPAPSQEPPPASPEPPPAAVSAPPAAPAPAPVPRGAEDPARVNWDELMKILRPGGGFDDPSRPEGQAFARVKAMGKGAYPYLLRYLDHEELPLAVAAARVLNELTGRHQPLPTLATRAQVKADWEAWIKANP